MSYFLPGGSKIPGSSNTDSSFIKSLKVSNFTDGMINIQGGHISGLSDPTGPTDAANKEYVDTASGGPFGNIVADSLTTPLVTGLNNPVDPEDAANKAYVDSLISDPGSIIYQVIVQKDPVTGQFASIEEAIASITDASASKPYCISVGPGIYNENTLVVPQYVSIKGESINTTIVSPNIPNQQLFIMNTRTELSFMTLQGIDGSVSPGPGAGYAAVYVEDVGDFAQLHKISIYDFDICIENYSTPSATQASNLYVEYTDVNGDYTYAVKNHSGTVPTVYTAYTSLENFFSYPSASVTKTVVSNDGVNTLLEFTACNFAGSTGMRAIDFQNGGSANVSSSLFTNFDNTAIYSENVGLGVSLRIDACTFVDCTLDFSIQNAGTTGFFFGNSPRDNHFIATTSTFFVAGEDSNVIRVAKRGGDYTSIKDAVDSITNASQINPYVVNIGPGVYTESTITLKTGVYLIGSSTSSTIIVPSVSTNTVIIGHDGSYINQLTVTGASGSGGIGMSYTGTTGVQMAVIDCIFQNNETNISITGSLASVTTLYASRLIIIGDTNCGILVTNSSSLQVRILLSSFVYQNTATVPVIPYLINASGPNIVMTIQNAGISILNPVVNTIAFQLNNGVNFAADCVGVKGFDTIIHVPAGAVNPTYVYATSILYNDIGTYLVNIENTSTIGYWDGETDYLKLSIPYASPFYISGTDQTIVTVQSKGGDFTSVASALASITDATSVKRYIIDIGPGTFTEPEIVMKQFVSIRGAGRSTVVQPDSVNHHTIRGVDFAELSSLILTGAGAGYAAIYLETPTGTNNTAFICREVLLGINDLHVWTYANVGEAHIILFNSRYGGTAQFNKGFLATNNNNSLNSKITIVGTVSQDFTSPLPQYVCYASGTNCTISLNGFNAIHNGSVEAGTVGFKVDNNALLRLVACTVRGFETAILSNNSGTGPKIISAGCTITDCTTDVNIQNPNTTGSINISASRTKTIVNGTPPVSLFLVDPDSTGIVFSGPFYYSKTNFNDITDVSYLITDTPTMGPISGGALSVSSGLTLAIASGTGYNDTIDSDVFYQSWNSGTIVLPANSNVYIYVNSNGIFSQSASLPDTQFNILLGFASTNASDIIYIQQTPLNAHHWSNDADLMLRSAIGPVYVSGSSVAELGTRQLTVSQGTYFFSTNKFLPEGASPATFTIYYRSVTPGVYTAIASQTTVPNTSYDNNSGTLQPLTASYYAKHLLCLLGGPSEVYALVYAQAEYSSQGAAEAAGLPVTPSFITDAFVRVVSIVVQQGNTNIVSFIDERPRIGFASSSTTGVITVHGDLLGLAANDHPQYLLVDGSAPGMTGDLDMNGNNIVAPGLYNGFNVSAHASRHAFNGADPLSPALSSDIAEISDSVASAGINNALIPRADHQHPHGNRGGGTLHATVIASGAAGFMSGSDKAKLDGIQAGATNTVASNIAPVNVTKSAASAGVSTEVSRYDHKHDISTAAPSTTLLTTSTNTEGSATSLSRSDHTHAISSDVPVTQIPDQTNAIGNSTAFARADHIHNIPTGTAAGLNANSTNTQGAASTFARSNHSHAIASGPPSTQTIALVAQTGTSTNFARADHIHTFSTDVPVTISNANSEGVSTSFARSDHVHNHGNQAGGSQHTTSTTSVAGFMSAADKTKSDSITLGGNFTMSGAYDFTGNLVDTTTVTFPTTGTLATTAQLPTPSALTKIDDTNITLTLGGTPATALLQSTSITAGWTGVLSATRGGTGVNNGSKTITLGGNLTTIGAFDTVLNIVGPTNINVPTNGTLATTGQLPVPAALTKADDTNITLTLDGSPSNALLQPASITAGWTGVLSGTRGGTGVNNSTRTITLGGNLVTSGSFNTTLVVTGTTNVTIPTTGTLATTSQLPVPAALTKVDDTNVTLTLGGTPSTALLQSTSITAGWSGQLSMSRGGTGTSLTGSNGGIFYSTDTTGAILSGTATAGQVLRSGASSAPSWSTAVYPVTTTANRLLYSSSTNTIGEITGVNNAGLLTNGSGVPSWVLCTGTGAPVLANTPTLITPVIGVASGTSLITSEAIGSTTFTSFSHITYTTIGNTVSITASQILNGYIDNNVNGNNTSTLPSASSIITSIPRAYDGMSFMCYFRKSGNNTLTIAVNTGITAVTGTTLTVATGSVRGFIFNITSVASNTISLLPTGNGTS